MNIAIQEELLGLCLNSDVEYLAVCDRLRAEHFPTPAYGAIWSAIDMLRKAGKKPEDSLIEAACESVDFEVTLSALLFTLRGNSPDGVHAEDYAEILIDKWTRCTFQEAATKLAALADDKDIHSDDLVETACRQLTKAFENETPTGIYTPADYARDQQEQAKGEVQPGQQVYTSFEPVDDLLAPLQPGNIIMLGGATSSGKSSLAQLLSWKAAQSGTPSLFITNEMTGRESMQRMVSQYSGVDLATVINPRQANNGERERINDATNQLRSLPITMFDGAGASVGSMRLLIMRAMRTRDVRLVIIDQLKFIKPDDKRAKEYEQISQITGDLKQCAKELGIPIILVCHLNRYGSSEANAKALTSKDLKRPNLSDLYGSSALEKDADGVLFVHRPEYWLERNKPTTDHKLYHDWGDSLDRWKGLAELVLVKRRQGGKGFDIRTVLWNGTTTTLSQRGSEASQQQERMAV